MDLQKVEWRGMDWTDLAENRERWRELVNAVMNSRVP
jgi:negative regulator of genetic competence, sporulation and motility